MKFVIDIDVQEWITNNQQSVLDAIETGAEAAQEFFSNHEATVNKLKVKWNFKVGVVDLGGKVDLEIICWVDLDYEFDHYEEAIKLESNMNKAIEEKLNEKGIERKDVPLFMISGITNLPVEEK